jgi:thymidylate synthase (FAD)
MPVFRFHVKLPIFIARQWIRHRTACLSGDTRISLDHYLLDDTIHETKTIKELYETFSINDVNGHFINTVKNLSIRNLNEQNEVLGRSHITDIWESGIKDVYRFKFEDGYELKCTKDHLVFTNVGWVKIGEMEDEKNSDMRIYGHCDSSNHRIVKMISLLSVEYVGQEMTYDLSVSGEFKNFIANGLVVHNSVNEQSGRYSIIKNEFYVPELDRLEKQSTTNKQGSDGLLNPENALIIQNLLKEEQELLAGNYNYYLKEDLARELARINLPLSTYTEWYWQIDLHNLLHFLKLRADSHAQKEIRDYSDAIVELIKDIVPLTMEAFNDYIVGAQSFSRMELLILSSLLKENKNDILNSLDYKEKGLTKREWEEFVVKLNKDN